MGKEIVYVSQDARDNVILAFVKDGEKQSTNPIGILNKLSTGKYQVTSRVTGSEGVLGSNLDRTGAETCLADNVALTDILDEKAYQLPDTAELGSKQADEEEVSGAGK